MFITLTAHSSQLTAHSSQLTAHSSQLTAHSSQLTAHSLGERTSKSSHLDQLFIHQKNNLARSYSARPKAENGFTLVELMVVIALLAIFASIAVPSFTTLIANTRTETTASELHGLLMSARSNAVTQRAETTLDTSSWQITQGGTAASTLAVPADVNLSSDPLNLAELSFQPDGSASQQVTLCLENDRGNRVYKISIQPSGIIRLSSAAACS